MNLLNYLIFFVLVYVFVFILYFFVVVNPQIRYMRNKKKENDNKKSKKKKKEKKYPTDLTLIKEYYKIDLEKIGVIRTLIILNIVNPFIMALLVTCVMPLKENWLKLLILVILIVPTIWITYSLLAKYLKYLERKSENV